MASSWHQNVRSLTRCGKAGQPFSPFTMRSLRRHGPRQGSRKIVVAAPLLVACSRHASFCGCAITTKDTCTMLLTTPHPLSLIPKFVRIPRTLCHKQGTAQNKGLKDIRNHTAPAWYSMSYARPRGQHRKYACCTIQGTSPPAGRPTRFIVWSTRFVVYFATRSAQNCECIYLARFILFRAIRTGSR